MRSSRGCQSDASVSLKSLMTSAAGARCLPVELTCQPSLVLVRVTSSVPMAVEPEKIVNEAVPCAGSAGAGVCAADAAAVNRIAASPDVRSLKGRMVSGYQEARTGAAFDERADKGRVLLTGSDARDFLHALLTNDIASIAPGSGCYAALLTPQGRMITDMDVLGFTAEQRAALLLVVSSDVAAPLAARLDKSIFAEQVEVWDMTGMTAHFSVVGPGAGTAIDAVAEALGHAGVAAGLVNAYDNAALGLGENKGALVWRSDELGLPGFDVAIPIEFADVLRATLTAGAAPLSAEARETLRVEAGRPKFHIDMTEETIPLEANLLDRAISTTKGCYVGQEVIIRVLHRGGGRVAKRLMKLRFEPVGAEGGAALEGPRSVAAPGATLLEGEREVGRVTSAVWSPRDGAAIGLGYVHRDFAREGVTLALSTGGTAAITGA